MGKLVILLFLSSLASLGAASAFAQSVNCLNAATGAGLTISTQYGFQMNDALVAELQRQGATQVVNRGDGGLEPSPNDPIQFEAGYPQAYSLQVGETSGGVSLTYTCYADAIQGKHAVHFFFNPGECTLN